MNFELVKKIFQKPTFKVLGWLASVVTFAAASTSIYINFFQEENGQIQFEILSESNVFDINNDITELDILYDSTSLKETGKNLRIISIRVKNTGAVNIEKSYYDAAYPIGVLINGGYILENPEILETSDDSYYPENIKPKIDSNKVTFSNVILNSNDYFGIKLLVLHDKNSEPTISAIGKVVSVEDIVILTSANISDDRPFFEKVISGSFWVHFLRFIGYWIIIGLIALTSNIVGNFIDYIKKERKIREREKLIKKFQNTEGYEYFDIFNTIFDQFSEGIDSSLREKYELLSDDQKLNDIYREVEEIRNLSNIKLPGVYENIHNEKFEELLLKKKLTHGQYFDKRGSWRLIQTMESEGFIFFDKNSFHVNKKLMQMLGEFIVFLDKNNSQKSSEELKTTT